MMKKIIGSLGCLALAMMCAFALADVVIDASNFPDKEFRAYVRQYDIDGDGTLSDAEIEAVTGMVVRGRSVSDLKGIEFFSSLTMLNCNQNELTSLDLRGNPALEFLSCGSNHLTELILSGNPSLMELDCKGNELAALDISGNPYLSILDCSKNRLTALDVSGNPYLYILTCFENQLETLNVDMNPGMSMLECYDNPLEQLDISKCPVLKELVEKTTPAENPGGSYGWWVEEEPGILTESLLVDQSVNIVTGVMK